MLTVYFVNYRCQIRNAFYSAYFFTQEDRTVFIDSIKKTINQNYSLGSEVVYPNAQSAVAEVRDAIKTSTLSKLNDFQKEALGITGK